MIYSSGAVRERMSRKKVAVADIMGKYCPFFTLHLLCMALNKNIKLKWY